MGRLDDLDLTLSFSREEGEERLADAQQRLLKLRLEAAGLVGDERTAGPSLCVVFEGWDASGKGGALKRLTSPLDPRHFHVASFAAPTPEELSHHFLWRFWPHLPGRGGMTVFDRSWYGRVLVERVEHLIDKKVWRRAYGEIVDFESMLAEEGVLFVKFWLHLSAEEQLKRFHAREEDPLKRWKLTDEDWRNREKADDYRAAVEDMLEETSTKVAPWTLVEAEDKRYARVKVVETVVAAYERALRS